MTKDEEGSCCKAIFWVPIEMDGLVYGLEEIQREVGEQP